jgi:hypothetical protein
MTAAAFNAITYANKLKDAGLDVRVADVQAEEMSNIFESTLATKRDLKELELRLIIKLGGMMVVQMGIIIAVLGFIVHK